jgi:uroporphyrin-3 C-methyltransferase
MVLPTPPSQHEARAEPSAPAGLEAAQPGQQTMAPLPAFEPSRKPLAHWLLVVTLVLASVALLSSLLLWQRLSSAQRQLARQSADSASVSVEARTMAREAQELARDTAARLAVLEVRVNEVALQRTQLEELMQSMSRSRDENLVVDIEAAVRLAQQQAVLTGSVEPLLAALRSASLRVARAAQPRLNTLQRAIERDIESIRTAKVVDIPTILVKLDEVVRLADSLPVANAPAAAAEAPVEKTRVVQVPPAWWQRLLAGGVDEIRALVRVSRIENPEASLLSPEQSFFLRENLKLILLNARLGLIARQPEAVQADLHAAQTALKKYFDPDSRRTQQAFAALQQVQGQLKMLELPRVDNTLTALAVAAAGR